MKPNCLLLAILLSLGLPSAYADRGDHERGNRDQSYERAYDQNDDRRDNSDRRDERHDKHRHDQGRHAGHDNSNNPHFRGYSGRDWDNDYGVSKGRCDSDAAGAAMGAVLGGVIGNQAVKDGDRRVATIFGAAIGAVLGAKIAHNIDRRDAACIGHSLELARDGERVGWDRDHRHYEVRPINRFKRGASVCRTYELITPDRTERQTACQTGPGVWEAR